MIRLAIASHHYAAEFEWTAAMLDEAAARLELWRAAVWTEGDDAVWLARDLAAALAADLDTPRALAVVDEWANQRVGARTAELAAPGAAAGIDALLGIDLT